MQVKPQEYVDILQNRPAGGNFNGFKLKFFSQ
jgi:hypothetical protein